MYLFLFLTMSISGATYASDMTSLGKIVAIQQATIEQLKRDLESKVNREEKSRNEDITKLKSEMAEMRKNLVVQITKSNQSLKEKIKTEIFSPLNLRLKTIEVATNEHSSRIKRLKTRADGVDSIVSKVGKGKETCLKKGKWLACMQNEQFVLYGPKGAFWASK